MVQMEDDQLDSGCHRWLTEASDAVNIAFVSSLQEMEKCKAFSPEFVHQHFGEKETIFGFEDLNINVVYSSASLYIYPEITYSKVVTTEDPSLKEDDIIKSLKQQLPEDQLEMMVDSKEQLETVLKKQSSFKPFGEMITKFKSNDSTFELYKISKSDPEGFDKYLARAQTLALWYIDAAQYTDNTDPLWLNYFLYEVKPNTEGDGGCRHLFAGYASLYKFYAYPEHERPRIAQIMLLPQYRRSGNGAKLLQSVYNDLYTMKQVRDVTAEDPADSFIYLRDYVDSVNCSKLPDFAPEKLKQGFSDEMKAVAQEKLKLNRRQVRRVYEILRLKHTNVADKEEMKAYRLDVKRRLEAPMRREQKDWNKLTKALDEEEMNQLAATQMSLEQKFEQLEKLFEQTVGEYRVTIDRLKTFSEIF